MKILLLFDSVSLTAFGPNTFESLGIDDAVFTE